MRMEMARVALSLACSMSCSRAFGSVFATFRPDDRRRVPARSARTNSRCVCRRPSGVAYQSASSASDLNLGTLGDLRGIFPPLRRIHFVGGHGAEPLAPNREDHDQGPVGCCFHDSAQAVPNREDHDQVAVGCCFPKSFHRSSPWTVFAGIVTCGRTATSSTSKGVTAWRRMWPTLAASQSKPLISSIPCLVYTMIVYTVNGACYAVDAVTPVHVADQVALGVFGKRLVVSVEATA